eukprot:COSAG01_NODE_6026_length_3894_cov_5.798419_4_plen_76_part_00
MVTYGGSAGSAQVLSTFRLNPMHNMSMDAEAEGEVRGEASTGVLVKIGSESPRKVGRGSTSGANGDLHQGLSGEF